MSKDMVDLRGPPPEQLDAALATSRESQCKLRIKHETGQLNETNQLTLVRKRIAKIKTLMNELKIKDSK